MLLPNHPTDFINFLTFRVSINILACEAFTLSLFSDFSETYFLKDGPIEWSWQLIFFWSFKVE